MSAVSGSPELLDALALGLGRQATGHGDAGGAMRHAVAATPRASVVGAAALDLFTDTARGLDDLQRGFDDLAGFVRRVSEALRAADDVLADAAGSSTTASTSPVSGGLAVGGVSGSAEWRRYEKGARRTISGTIDHPFAPSRSRTVMRADGSVQDGFTDMEHGVTLWTASATRSWGTGVGGRWGSDTTHVRVEAFKGAQVSGTTSAGYAKGQAQLSAGGSAMYGVTAAATARAGNEYAAVEGAVRAFAGVRADGDALLGIGKEGIDAEVSARALAGGEVEGSAVAEVLGVRGEATGSVLYGIGGEFKGDVEVSLDNIEFSLDLGLAFGLGVSGGFDVRVNPREVASKTAKAVSKPVKSVARAVGGLFS